MVSYCLLGGVAVANYDSVTDGDKVVATAMKTFGRVDILVNNAGILRDVSFVKMTKAQWNQVFDVHLQGSTCCSYYNHCGCMRHTVI